MISFFSTIDELISALQHMKEAVGGNRCCGTTLDNKKHIEDLSHLEYVFISEETGEIVGYESSDYVPKSGEVPAILIG